MPRVPYNVGVYPYRKVGGEFVYWQYSGVGAGLVPDQSVFKKEVLDMLKEYAFDTGEVTLNVAQGPASGPPLLLIHGGGDRWQNFLPIIPSLMSRWQIIAPDLRGHGKSGRVPGCYRPEHYATDIVALLERHVAEPAILFGHSLGGWIALMVAAQRSEQVRALILGDPPLCIERFLEIEGSEQGIGMWRWMHDLATADLTVHELADRLASVPGPNAAQRRAWARTLSQVDPDVAQYHASGRLDEYVTEMQVDALLERVSCSTLLLQGDPEQGAMVKDEDVPSILSHLADGLHVQLPGEGHNLGLDVWQVSSLLCAVTSFIESL